MNTLRALPLLLLLALASPAVDAQAPLVVFIEDTELQSASALNEAEDGVSQLAAVFTGLGAEVISLSLDDPLPPADVIVLVRPRRALSSAAAARLWVAVEGGANLLLALDPAGQSGIAGEPSDRGIARLLLDDYGLGLLDGFLVGDGFTPESIRDSATSTLNVSAQPAPHPIMLPFLDYELAVTTWGARAVLPDALGIDSAAVPLLYTESAYAETARNLFRENNPDPLTVDLDADTLGRLFVAAVGENTRLNNRAALITDGEMLLNGFGFARAADGASVHLGNVVFASRLAAWLLSLPESAYPALPGGYAYLRIDGDGSDWYAEVPLVRDRGSDFSNARYNLRTISAFHNRQSLYILIEMAAPPDPASTLILQFDSTGDGAADSFVTVDGDRFFLQAGANVGLLAEARIGVDLAFELRLPLQFAGTIFTVCVSAPPDTAAGDPDCADDPVQATEISLRDLPIAPRTP